MADTGSGRIRRINRKQKHKLLKKNGTTLVETLVAFLIVVLMLGMLAHVMVMTANLKYKTDKISKANEKSMEAYWSWRENQGSVPSQKIELRDSNYGVTLPGVLHTIDEGGNAVIYDISVK